MVRRSSELLLFGVIFAVVHASTLRRAILCCYYDKAPLVTRGFLLYCLLGQLVMGTGLSFDSSAMNKTGHLVYTSALVVGSLALPARSFEHDLVLVLCALTLVTRRMFGGCMISHARGDTATSSREYDLLYLCPLVAGSLRKLFATA